MRVRRHPQEGRPRLCDAAQWSRLKFNIGPAEHGVLPTRRQELRNATWRDALLQDRASAARGSLCASRLSGMTSLDVLEWFVDTFAARGILVLLDLHCLSPGCLARTRGTRATTNQPKLFFDKTHPVELVLKGWSDLASRFADKWK